MLNWEHIRKSKLLTVVVSVAMILSALGLLFTCIGCKPVIVSVSSTYGGAGDTITVIGLFLETSGSIKIANGKGQSHTIQSDDCQWTDTRITFQIPSNLDWQPSDPGGGSLTITNSEGPRVQPFTFIVGDVLPLDIIINNSSGITGPEYYRAYYSMDNGSSWVLMGTVRPDTTFTYRMNVSVSPGYRVPIVRVQLYQGYTYGVGLTVSGSAVFGQTRDYNNGTWRNFYWTGKQYASIGGPSQPPQHYWTDVQVKPK